MTGVRWLPLTLWPNVTFLPKMLPRNRLDWQIPLAQFNHQSTDCEVQLLCPVQVLAAFIDTTAPVQQTLQLSVCYGFMTEVVPSLNICCTGLWALISHTNKVAGCPLPAGRAPFNMGSSTSWAALRGVLWDVICAAAS